MGMKQILVMMVAVVVLVGCGPSAEDRYIGKWKYDGLGEFTLTIVKDGTYTLNHKETSTSQSGTWEVKEKVGFLYIYSVNPAEFFSKQSRKEGVREAWVFFSSPDDESETMGLNFSISNGVREYFDGWGAWHRIK
jgi:hypothetical protein|tara:strand:+ start:136 stop:540 length:405 start_codon:yes stop_codon:yes gene_type:complete